MLPKKNRADRKLVNKIFKACLPNGREGRFLNSPNLTFKFLQNKAGLTQISFVCPKSIAKRAVDRNLLRRRGYSALKSYLPLFPVGLKGVFVFNKKGLKENTILILDNEIKNILKKISK